MDSLSGDDRTRAGETAESQSIGRTIDDIAQRLQEMQMELAARVAVVKTDVEPPDRPVL